MNITRARPEDADWLDEQIREEFPYTEFTPKNIVERINNPKYIVIVARQENIITGFAEIELFIEDSEARLNAIFVDDAWRGQQIATELIQKAINECKHKKLQRLFLLVKENNVGAKELYKKTGFEYEGPHDKIIQGSKIEIWSQGI
jgi:ribosomal protein S18 acetylase RimI-like enzyme